MPPPPGRVILRPSPGDVLTHVRISSKCVQDSSLAFEGGNIKDPPGLSQITHVSGVELWKLQYPRVDQYDTSSENIQSMLCQVIKLWRHMSGHVRLKSADFAICRTSVCFLASQRRTMHRMLDYLCLRMRRRHMQLTRDGSRWYRILLDWAVFWASFKPI